MKKSKVKIAKIYMIAGMIAMTSILPPFTMEARATSEGRYK